MQNRQEIEALAQSLSKSIVGSLREADADPLEPNMQLADWTEELCAEFFDDNADQYAKTKDLSTAANIAQIAQLAIMIAQLAYAGRSLNLSGDSLVGHIIQQVTEKASWLRIGILNKYCRQLAEEAVRKLNIK